MLVKLTQEASEEGRVEAEGQRRRDRAVQHLLARANAVLRHDRAALHRLDGLCALTLCARALLETYRVTATRARIQQNLVEIGGAQSLPAARA